MLNATLRKIYYRLKPCIPRRVQLCLRRKMIALIMLQKKRVWPIDERAGYLPRNWQGWPQKKRFALVLTHDVDTIKGQEKCRKLIALETRLGFRSSFNFVIENEISANIRLFIQREGFEVGVHGLTHDGSLYRTRAEFLSQARIINQHLTEWHAVGFRSPAMHHNLSWIHDLDIEYDASTFDTDPFEPQSDGVKTIFPFYVENPNGRDGYVELPYTLPQDFTVFVLMGNKNIDIWKKKLDWVCKRGGMVLVNTHPDYMNFEGEKLSYEEYPARLYAEFLDYVRSSYEGDFWHALPREMANFWREDYREFPEVRHGSHA